MGGQRNACARNARRSPTPRSDPPCPAPSASRAYAEKVEEKVKAVQEASAQRLAYVEKKYEKALLGARQVTTPAAQAPSCCRPVLSYCGVGGACQAAGSERSHDLERTKAAHNEAVRKLREEFEVRTPSPDSMGRAPTPCRSDRTEAASKTLAVLWLVDLSVDLAECRLNAIVWCTVLCWLCCAVWCAVMC